MSINPFEFGEVPEERDKQKKEFYDLFVNDPTLADLAIKVSKMDNYQKFCAKCYLAFVTAFPKKRVNTTSVTEEHKFKLFHNIIDMLIEYINDKGNISNVEIGEIVSGIIAVGESENHYNIGFIIDQLSDTVKKRMG